MSVMNYKKSPETKPRHYLNSNKICLFTLIKKKVTRLRKRKGSTNQHKKLQNVEKLQKEIANLEEK